MNKQRILSLIKKYSLIFLFLGIGFTLGVFFTSNPHKEERESKEIRVGTHGLINPLLACEIGGETIASRKQNFGSELRGLVGRMQRDRQLVDVSVYFRDMNNGPVVSINENEPFIPASLLKVPILMAYLARVELVPDLLKRRVLYENKELSNSQLIKPDSYLVFGKEYTVGELLEQMIIFSDNNALLSLLPTLPKQELINLYTLLDIPIDVAENVSATITVKQYSAFFRVLFNASYLSPRASDLSLSLLTKTAFGEGLVGGIPDKKIAIAHKFGERKIGDSLQQLHDCGIIYYPNHPYLLCVMTRGYDIPNLERSIVDISRFVYEKIDEQYGG